MKRLLIWWVVVLMLGGCAGIDIHGTGYEQRAVALQNLIVELQSALAVFNDEVDKKTSLVLSSASLSLTTAVEKSVGGSTKVVVVSGEAARADETSDLVSIKLVPLPRTKAMMELPIKTLSERLALSIVSAVEGVSKAGTGKYPMAVHELTIEIGITTTTSASAGGGITLEVIPVSIGGQGRYSKADTNILKLEFAQKP
jgi:hypothetical protein